MSHSPNSPSSLLEKLQTGELLGAKRLDLSADLTEFPREIFQLADSLEVLNLSGNLLSALPGDLNRLHRLRILFCSDNRFTELPSVLGRCTSLSMVGFKANRIHTVPPDAFPPELRWLILTDNQITELPGSIGRCSRLQKLMLSGNRLSMLPEELAECRTLEMVRIAANAFTALPEWLLELPSLAWLAASGNPLNAQTPSAVQSLPPIPWENLTAHGKLGEGASGVILRADWQGEAVAVKIFKGAVTSDGLPAQELEATLKAGTHPHLIPLIAPLENHPEEKLGLVMRLLPEGCSSLGNPPSLDSCTRDTYPEEARFLLKEILSVAKKVAAAAAHLHRRGVMHGDLYAHNIAWTREGHCFLSDFGAATCYASDPSGKAHALQRLDVLAFGRLLGELLERSEDMVPEPLSSLHRLCVFETPSSRPAFEEIQTALAAV